MSGAVMSLWNVDFPKVQAFLKQTQLGNLGRFSCTWRLCFIRGTQFYPTNAALSEGTVVEVGSCLRPEFLNLERDLTPSVLAILGDDFPTGLASDVATASTSEATAAAVVSEAVVARGFLDLRQATVGVASVELSIPGSTLVAVLPASELELSQ